MKHKHFLDYIITVCGNATVVGAALLIFKETEITQTILATLAFFFFGGFLAWKVGE